MKSLFDKVSIECSRLTTRTYSTSFSLGISFLARPLRDPICAIYGFVRLADEIVDSFHGYQKKELLESFRKDTEMAIRDKISLNPILNSFQFVVHKYSILQQWIDIFLDSMAMDLQHQQYDYKKYQEYIFGSAEVVGLMCLHVFTGGDQSLFEKLKPYAMKLGAAFQKVNFLRDIRSDNLLLGRTYFPGVDLSRFSKAEKLKIEKEIEADFLKAIKKNFTVKKSTGAFSPADLHEFGMYLNDQWYKLSANEGTYTTDPIGVLDISILQQNLLDPVLNIKDQRTDRRIDFVGGIRGLGELEKRVNSGEMAVAFSLYPVSIQQLFDIADSGNVMPPKSTWFEPKLRDGLLTHLIDTVKY